jgi:hypothetical protein
MMEYTIVHPVDTRASEHILVWEALGPMPSERSNGGAPPPILSCCREMEVWLVPGPRDGVDGRALRNERDGRKAWNQEAQLMGKSSPSSTSDADQTP